MSAEGFVWLGVAIIGSVALIHRVFLVTQSLRGRKPPTVQEQLWKRVVKS